MALEVERDDVEPGQSPHDDGEAAFQTAPYGFLSTSPDGAIVQVNDTFLSWTGHNRETLLAGMRFQDLLKTPDSILFYETQLAPLLQGQGVVREFPCELERRGREPLRAFVDSRVILDAQGMPAMIRMAVFEASGPGGHEEAQRLARLREGEERLRLAVQATGIGIYDFDPPTGQQFWSDACKAIWGFASDMTVTPAAVLAAVHPDDREWVERLVVGSLDPNGPGEFAMAHRILRPDGAVRWIEVRGKTIFDEDRTAATRAVGTMLDITDRKAAEDRLRENAQRLRDSEERLSIALRASGTGVWDWDLTTDSVTWSGQIHSIFGVETFDGTAAAFERFVHPDDLPRLHETVQRVFAAGSIYETEFRIVRPNGEVRWVNNYGKPDYDENGKPVRLLGTVSDITERKETEARLRESEERLSSALRAGQLGVHEFNPITGEIKWDATVRRLWGVSADEPIHYETFAAGVHPEDMHHVQASVDAALDPTGDGHYKAEYRVISRSDQSVRWVRADGDVTFAGGKAVRLVGTVHDITASRQAQDRLRESEERFKTAVDAADLGVWELDLTTDAMLQRSLRHDEMFGYRELQPEWSSAIAERHMVEEDRPVFREAMARAVETGALSFEARVRWSDGSIHWIAPRGRTHYDESGVATRMTGVVADITERKRHEEQVQFLLRELDHRSKNLLGLVQAVARQTAQGNPEDFLERFGQRIRALSASQDLLLKSEWKGVSLAELARSQLAHFQDLIDRRIVLRGPLLKTTPQAAQTLAMALHELATNAGKYGALSSETGSVEICWELRVAPGRGERFICVWSERDGPAVAAPTRRGFGSTVLERMARVALGAEVKLDFAEAGLVWRLDCPSDRVLESAAPPQQLSGGVAAMSG